LWYILSWTWKGGQPKLNTSSITFPRLSLTTGNDTRTETVPYLSPHSAYRTLGVYVSPSGSQKKQVNILHSYSDRYFSSVLNSSLSPEEAYWSYSLFLRPKLIYPLACSSLTQQQCKHIQAPALAALLTKLHLNRHSPHAVIFGGYQYGGLSLPDLYTDQGYGQLRLLLGHVKLGDDNGNLIQIEITYVQLCTGVLSPFFQWPYPYFAKWIDHTWISSVWKYSHQIGISIELENTWLPTLYRKGDQSLMELLLSLHLHPSTISEINQCCLFLQVITISDITTADGNLILPEVLEGASIPYRSSVLSWPRQNCPHHNAWRKWNNFLQHIHRNGTLITPLRS
jgi:hypothetical protein